MLTLSDSTATDITTAFETTQTQSSIGTTTASFSVCPTLIANPTYTPTSPLPTDYTWGCPPGYLCKPPHTGDRAHCNVEAGLPAASYVCSPSECIVSPPLVSEQGSNAVGHHYNVSDEYYNLDPEDFGLRYSIFKGSEESTTAIRKRDLITLDGSGISLWNVFSSQRIKRDISDIPGVCYNDCNDAALEPQEIGKIHELCESDSAFMVELGNCKTCISTYASSPSAAWSQRLLPSFAQFLDYCSNLTTTSTSVAAETTTLSTTTSAGATETSVLLTGGSTATSVEVSTVATTLTSTQSMSIQVSEEAVTTSFAALTWTVTRNSESSDTTKATNSANTDSTITVSTQTGQTSSSAWTTLATTKRTASGTGSMVSESGAERTVTQDGKLTGKPSTTGDAFINSGIHTTKASASTSASIFDSPHFASASANGVPHVGLLSCLLAVILSIL
ncbi:uncharacterized protein N7498_000554 [Penicillium cinerascens]|uniref:Uncharacterized protein n=1 Tax=Penicillium cinerascens TaxID=70096 RepID=A0A9W9NEK3_9EURO|nr:uncharacterized protein N7498_000554 [Penicillium cinerascens]KAJ5218455.1 hypothetical protein N7498_000554 [Penicillium cinerascens]